MTLIFAAQAAQFAPALLAWFDLHGRKNLPWQQNPTPYRVWVSEVMLQQTQVATVIPYFERFMQRFETLQSLADAPLDEVLHLWTGLGYYARARNLHACAKTLIATQGGEFPMTLENMMALPGIGRSTAGAILALSMGQRHAILDGNVRRVLARVFGIAGDPSSPKVVKDLWETAGVCTPQNKVAAYTQAIMDLGATLCTRARPACSRCPMIALCVAAREGRQATLPGAKPRRTRQAREGILLIVELRRAELQQGDSRAVLLERRPLRGVWGGLYSPPQFADESSALEWCLRELGLGVGISRRWLPVIDHSFTHFDLRLRPLCVRVDGVVGGVGAVGVEGVREGDDCDRLWYPLLAATATATATGAVAEREVPVRVGLPQPIRLLLERLATSVGG